MRKKNTNPVFKIINTIIVLSLLMLASCATRDKGERFAPDWFRNLEESEDGSAWLIKISAFGGSEISVRDRAADELLDRILELSGEESLFSASADREWLKEQLSSLIDTEAVVDGVVSLYRQEWHIEGDESYYYGAFYVDKSADTALNTALLDRYYTGNEVLNSYLAASESLEESGKYYRAAEVLLEAAAYLAELPDPLSDHLARIYISKAASLLELIKVAGVAAPEQAYANTMIAEPFQLFSSSDEGPTPEVEYLVGYDGKKRDGSRGQFERRLVSRPEGLIDFYHPFIPFTGEAQVRFIPGSRDFHSSLLILQNSGLDISQIQDWVAAYSFDYGLPVDSLSRDLKMGVVVLHTDITGSALNNAETAVGIVETLVQNGYNIDILTLDPLEITREGESAFLRDIKALYKEDYIRVVYGTVEIQNFEAVSDSYRVKTGGSLSVVDVDSGELLVSLELDKSVESRSNTLAVSASFRELGKAFALELIESLE